MTAWFQGRAQKVMGSLGSLNSSLLSMASVDVEQAADPTEELSSIIRQLRQVEGLVLSCEQILQVCEVEMKMQQMFKYLYYEIDNTEVVQVQQEVTLLVLIVELEEMV